MIGVVVAAAGFTLVRATWDRADEFIVRQYSPDWRPWKRGEAIRVRLDLDRLRAFALSREDVMKAFAESRMIDPVQTKRADPPPGVVFVTRLARLDRNQNIILRANAQGEIIRLKDVAKVEVAW